MVEELAIILDYPIMQVVMSGGIVIERKSLMNEKKKGEWLQELGSTLMNFHKVKRSNTMSNIKEKVRLNEMFSLTYHNTKHYKSLYTMFLNSRNRAKLAKKVT